jgi:hypothetical protein
MVMVTGCLDGDKLDALTRYRGRNPPPLRAGEEIEFRYLAGRVMAKVTGHSPEGKPTVEFRNINNS